MSRTLKDRPEWVKQNDKNLPRTASHDHEHAGEPVYRYQPVKDENGNNVIETYTYHGFLGFEIYNYYERRYKRYDTWEELLADNSSREYLLPKEPPYFGYKRYGEKQGTRVKMERAIIGYRPTECTIDAYVPRENKWFDNETIILCEHNPARWKSKGGWCGHHFPIKEEKEEYHRSSRSSEKQVLRKLTKAAGAGFGYEDDDDMDGDVFFKRRRRHRGYWC